MWVRAYRNLADPGAWSDFLLDIIKTATAPDMRTVVVRAIECVTLPVFLRALCSMPVSLRKITLTIEPAPQSITDYARHPAAPE